LNLNISKEIFSQLIKGCYINKDIIDTDTNIIEDNNLYNEIDKNFQDYYNIYESLGYELKHEIDNFFYLYKETDDELNIDRGQLKEYILILLLIRYCLENKIPINNLTSIDKGIEQKVAKSILTSEKYKDILMVSELNSEHVFNTVLMNKNIIELNNKQNYIFTNIGKYILEYLIQEEKKNHKE